MGISVLMSVYEKEKPQYLRRALESIFEQTLKCDEVVLIKDGELGSDLESVVQAFVAQYPQLKPYALKQNVKLGKALAIGVELCENEFIARMDTDDIAEPNRLKIQYEYMSQNPKLAVVGGNIAEFTKEGEVLQVKSMPVDDEAVYDYGKYRNPLNHMTVMFRRQAVLDCGNYQHFPLLEDYHLWIRMIAKGYTIQNIPEILVNARIDRAFSKKRGGFSYFRQYLQLRKLQHTIGYTNKKEYIVGIFCSFIMTMQPAWTRNLVYKYVLRKVKK